MALTLALRRSSGDGDCDFFCDMKIGSINVVLGILEAQIDEEIGFYGSTEEFGLKSQGEIMFFGHKRTGSDWTFLMKTNHGIRKEGFLG